MTRADENEAGLHEARLNEADLLDFVRRRMLDDPSVSLEPQSELFAGKIIDSINILRFIGYVEKRLGRRLRDDELVMENFRSVRVICERFLNETEDHGPVG